MRKGVSAICIVDKRDLYSIELFYKKCITFLCGCIYSHCIKSGVMAIFQCVYNALLVSVHTVIICKCEKVETASFECRKVAFGCVEAVAFVREFHFFSRYWRFKISNEIVTVFELVGSLKDRGIVIPCKLCHIG